MSTTRTEHEQAAYDLGVEHARNAASWLEPNTLSERTIRRMLAMIDNGDPAAEEWLPREPNLSGEYADDLTPAGLADEILGTDWPHHPDVADPLCDAYEAGVSDTFASECERILRAAL